MTAKTKIHREMTIEDILSEFPEKSQKLAQEITNAGLHCVGCSAATWETLEAGMLSHGYADEEIDQLVDNLNDILDQELDLTKISITQRAAEKFLEILEEEGKLGYGLRFGDRPGGCSGFEYVLDFSEKAEADDAVFENFGIQIHVKQNSVDRLMGSEIDFVDGLNGAGFKISNPNAKGNCGCGKSQSY
jgi:iron-sulfur cluster assembly accessory protein